MAVWFRRLSQQAREAMVVSVLMMVLVACFPDHVFVIVGLSIVLLLAIDDLSCVALRMAIKDRAVGRATDGRPIYVILPHCRFKLLVLRQLIVEGESLLAGKQPRDGNKKRER